MAANVWKGHLTFGLVSLPIKLFVAARQENLSFNQLHKKDHSRLKQVLYCATEDKPISRDEVVKGYEYAKDQYVLIDENDLERAKPATSSAMEILEFVKASDVDPVFLEGSYFAVPDTAGERAYALLFESMKRTGMVGIAKVAMHAREHIVVLRPGSKGILLHTMFYKHEVRELGEFRTDTSSVTDKELSLAKLLIKSLAAEFTPQKYQDDYRENVMAMIKAKVDGTESDPTKAATARPLAPVINILDALKKSLNNPSPGRQLPAAAAEQKQEERRPGRAQRHASKAGGKSAQKVASGLGEGVGAGASA